MILKEDIKTRQKAKGDIATILGILDDLPSDDAVAFIKWMSRKASMYRDAILYASYPILPENMQRGDIVLCDLGVNIPHEFSDRETGKHFVLFWAQQGHNAIVIPITSKRAEENNQFIVSIGAVAGLPEDENYVKLDAIRSVSLRRISRIHGFSSGKTHSDVAVIKIKKALINVFINDQ